MSTPALSNRTTNWKNVLLYLAGLSLVTFAANILCHLVASHYSMEGFFLTLGVGVFLVTGGLVYLGFLLPAAFWITGGTFMAMETLFGAILQGGLLSPLEAIFIPIGLGIAITELRKVC